MFTAEDGAPSFASDFAEGQKKWGRSMNGSSEYKAIRTLIDQGRLADAFSESRKLAASGSIDAKILLAWLLHTGRGVARDLESAEKLYEEAAKTGSPVAQFYLGKLYFDLAKYSEGIQWLERAALQNYAPAQYRLGLVYDSEKSAYHDRDMAKSYFARASDLGHLFARRRLALNAIKGRYGLVSVPVGMLSLVMALVIGVRAIARDPDAADELYLRE